MSLPPSARRRDLLAFFLVWIPYAILVRRFWFIADDAYISFRFSRNWGSGLGLRYNLGDHPPEEGFSNFLYVAFGAIAHALGGSIEFWLPAIAFLSGSVLMYLVFRVVRTRFGAELYVACLAAAALGYAAQFTVWSTSGLETVTYSLLTFIAFERLILREAGAHAIAAGLAAVGMALIRVEGVYWAVVLIPLAAFSLKLRGKPIARPLATYAALLAVGYGAWFFWKYQYYGYAFSATVHSKVAFSVDRLQRGFQYVAVQYLTSLSLFIALPGLWVVLRRRERWAIGLPVAAMPFGYAAYATLVSGDFMTFGRFLVPSLAFNALLLGWVLIDVSAAGRRPRLAQAMGALVIVLGVLPGFNVHPVPFSVRESMHFRRRREDFRTEYEQWKSMKENGIRWAWRGIALRTISEPSDSIVMSAIGATGYTSGLYVFDRHGFVTPFVAMREREERPELELRSPGHDDPVEEVYFLEQGYEPTYIRPFVYYEDDREEIISRIKSGRRMLNKTLGKDAPYFLAFYEIPTSDPSRGGQAHLIVWQRLREGQRMRDAEVEFDTRLLRLEREGWVEPIDMEPPSGRVAGLPRWL